MIRLTRQRSVAAIPPKYRGNTRVTKLLELVKSHRAGSREIDGQYWKQAKAQLRREAGGKCAYCEADTAVVAHGDVEHFRPKDVYWWLAYCYDNYLFSCQICNQSFKGANFPVAGPAMAEPQLALNLTDSQLRDLVRALTPDPLSDADGQPMAQFLAALTAEAGDLPNPYGEEDPEPLFKWVADDVLMEVVIAPRDASPRARRAFDAVDRFLGLNREELRRLRWDAFASLRVFRRFIELDVHDAAVDAVREETKQLVLRRLEPTSEFAGMVRYFVREEWRLVLS